MTQHSELSTPNLSLDGATLYLASRARVRTPLGAGEYLHCVRHHARSEYDERVKLAVDCCNLYRQIFPRDYARSPAAPFSIAREHEFYRLVNAQCFPLLVDVDEETDLLTYLEREPRFFLPFIPIRGMQKHHWQAGRYDFDSLDLPYQLAMLLSTGDGQPVTIKGESPVELPPVAPPLAVVGWSLFKHSCRVSESPLQYLPLAFNLINYQTGNIWLDLPPIGYAGEAWSAEQIARLTLNRMQADKYEISMRILHNWFMADPAGRLRHAIELWNDASRKEQESGYEGMNTDDLADAGWGRLEGGPGGDMVVIPPDQYRQLYGEEANG